MKPFDQTILAGGDRLGDCWRACVASLVEVPVAEVPHFVELDERSKVGAFDGMTDTWLRRTRGLRLVSPLIASSNGVQYLFDRDDGHRIGGKIFPEFLIVGGMSPRGIGHAVIARAADYLSIRASESTAIEPCERWMEHDPHPSRAGLVSWFEVFAILPIALEPSQERAA